MNADYPLIQLTEQVIAASYRVHNTLGAGFVESVYVRALSVELRLGGISAQPELPITVTYREHIVGEFRADLLVAHELIVEVKAVKDIVPMHEIQLLNYLHATGKSVGLLINFGGSVQVRRKIQTKNLRQSAQSA